MSFLRSVLIGTAAGAVGTTALNVVTYADMATRGRPESSMPSTLLKKAASSAEHRRTGVGALLRERVAGAAAMALSDVPATKAGVTDPRTWGLGGWLADAIPHAIYGLGVATTFDALDDC